MTCLLLSGLQSPNLDAEALSLHSPCQLGGASRTKLSARHRWRVGPPLGSSDNRGEPCLDPWQEELHWYIFRNNNQWFINDACLYNFKMDFPFKTIQGHDHLNLSSTSEAAPRRCEQFQESRSKRPPARPHARPAAVLQLLPVDSLTNARMWSAWAALFQPCESWQRVCGRQSDAWRSRRSSARTDFLDPDTRPSWTPRRQKMTAKKKKWDSRMRDVY